MSNRKYSLFNPMIDFVLDDIDAVKKAIYLILMTNCGERVMRSYFGTRLREMLFQPLEEISEIMFKDDLIKTLEYALPMIQIKGIKITKYPKENKLKLNINFVLRTINQEDGLELEIPWKS